MFQQGRAGTGARAAMSAFTWGRDYFAPALPLTLIHPSAWRNCLENSRRPRERAAWAAKAADRGSFGPLCGLRNPYFGTHPDFPNSFGRGILRSSPWTGFLEVPLRAHRG
jgi:hypothetical protein